MSFKYYTFISILVVICIFLIWYLSNKYESRKQKEYEISKKIEEEKRKQEEEERKRKFEEDFLRNHTEDELRSYYLDESLKRKQREAEKEQRRYQEAMEWRNAPTSGDYFISDTYNGTRYCKRCDYDICKHCIRKEEYIRNSGPCRM